MATRPGLSEKIAELSQLINSLSSIEKVLSVAENHQVTEVLKSGFVKQFEISVELFWKIQKAKLTTQTGIELSSPKPILKASLQEGMLTTGQFNILHRSVELRNLAAHIYQDELVDEILDFIPTFCETVNEIINH